MPTASQHKIKAEGNRRHLGTINVTDHADWAVVVAFYTAVHLVERVRAGDQGLGTKSRHSGDHYDRLNYVQTHHRPIHDPFRQLWNLSKIARYEANARFYDQVSSDDVKARVIDGWLVAVERYVTSKLGG